MKLKTLINLTLIILLVSCEKDSELYNRIEGKWKLVKTQDIGNFEEYPTLENQRIREFKSNKIHVSYDANGNVSGESNYELTKTTIILYEDAFRTENLYWLIDDTLKIRNDGGFEYYDEYFIKQ